MASYLSNDLAFEVDGAFTDETVDILASPLDNGGELGVWISREPLPAGQSVGEAARGWIANRRERLDGYEVLGERQGEVAGAESLEFSARFRDDDTIVYERQTHLAVAGVWYCATARAPMVERDACDETMDRIVETLLVRGES